MEISQVQRLVRKLGGVATLAELKQQVPAHAIRAALDEGGLVRLHRTKVVLAGTDEARAAALRSGGQVSHLSAAMAHGWKVHRPPTQPMITVPRGSKVRRSEGLAVHWSSRPPGPPGSLTSPVDTVIDCARSLPFAAGLAVADSSLRARAVSKRQLIRAAEQSPRTGRSQALRVVTRATGRAANPFESALRAIALDVEGFTATAQCPVEAIGHADVGDERLEIALEAESFEFHAERAAFSYDIRRYTAMTRAGWLVGRFTWDDVMHREAYVHDVIAGLVSLRVSSSSCRCCG